MRCFHEAVAVKLGVTPWLADRTAAGLAGQAGRAEGWGYDSFWLPESHFGADSIPEPLMLLAAAAAGSTRIRLGTTSLLLPFRNPLQAAEQVAVLDRLSGGRVILGVGRGYAPRLLRAFGVDPRHKRALFQASLLQMMQAWRGEPVLVAGLGDDGVVLDPLPVQKPHPPVWVAAFGPKALTQAGDLGLPYLASPVEPLDVLEDNYRRHCAAAAQARRPLPTEVPVMRVVFVTDDGPETARVRAALEAASTRRPGGAPAGPVEGWSIVGEAGYVAERVAEYRQRLGMTHLIVTRVRNAAVDPARISRSVARTAEVLAACAT